MVNGTPLEKHIARLDVDFLESAVLEISDAGSDAEVGQIVGNGHVRGDERRLSVLDDVELVHVHGRNAAAAHLDRLDDRVRLIQDQAMAAGVSLQLVALHEAEMVAAFVRADLHIMSSRGAREAKARPDQVLPTVLAQCLEICVQDLDSY